jgi:hypothetical protein
MISLKTYTPILARLLDMTPDTLYERQRAMVRLGLLDAPTGRGPGSGVPAVPATVSFMIALALATDSLSEIDHKVRKLADARAVTKVCPLTGKVKFREALAKILASEAIAEKVQSIDVTRSDLQAKIRYIEDGRSEVSRFGKDPVQGSSGLSIEAILPGSAVKTISEQLKAIADDLAVGG